VFWGRKISKSISCFDPRKTWLLSWRKKSILLMYIFLEGKHINFIRVINHRVSELYKQTAEKRDSVGDGWNDWP